MYFDSIRVNSFVVKVICFIVFAIFVFFYISSYQADLFFVAQDSIANGKTTFYPIIAGIVMVVLLYGLQRLVLNFFRFKDNVFTLSYIPSFLVLILIADICSAVVRHISCWHLLFTVPLAIVLTFFLFKLVLQFGNRKNLDYGLQMLPKELWSNLVILLTMIILTLACSTNSNNLRSSIAHDSYYIKQQHELERQAILKAEQDSLRQIFIKDSIIAARDSIRKEKLRRDSLAELEKNRIGG